MSNKTPEIQGDVSLLYDLYATDNKSRDYLNNLFGYTDGILRKNCYKKVYQLSIDEICDNMKIGGLMFTFSSEKYDKSEGMFKARHIENILSKYNEYNFLTEYMEDLGYEYPTYNEYLANPEFLGVCRDVLANLNYKRGETRGLPWGFAVGVSNRSINKQLNTIYDKSITINKIQVDKNNINSDSTCELDLKNTSADIVFNKELVKDIKKEEFDRSIEESKDFAIPNLKDFKYSPKQGVTIVTLQNKLPNFLDMRNKTEYCEYNCQFHRIDSEFIKRSFYGILQLGKKLVKQIVKIQEEKGELYLSFMIYVIGSDGHNQYFVKLINDDEIDKYVIMSKDGVFHDMKIKLSYEQNKAQKKLILQLESKELHLGHFKNLILLTYMKKKKYEKEYARKLYKNIIQKNSIDDFDIQWDSIKI